MNNVDIQLIKKVENAKLPELDNTRIKFYVNTLRQGVTQDRRLVLEYQSGYDIVIPDGYIGIMNTEADVFMKSVEAPGAPFVLRHGRHSLDLKMKVYTDSVPVIYEDGDEFLYVDIMKNDVNMVYNIVDEIPSEETKESDK